MKQSNNSFAGLVIVSALALGAATAVLAAGNQYTGGYPGMMGGPGMMGTPDDAAKRLDEVKGELGITSTQEDA